MNDVNDVESTRERIKIILDSSGYSLRRFAHEIGITPGGLSGILNGRSKVISGMFLKLLEYRFNVNLVWLETGEGQTYTKKFLVDDPNETELIRKFRNLGREQKKSILLMTDALYQQMQPKNSPDSMVAETLRKKSKNWP